MYKKFKAVDERDRRIYMAGLSLTQLIGYETARQFCMNTVLAIGDIDTDEMLFFSNSIDRDVKNVEEGNTLKYSTYFYAAVDGYVHEKYREDARWFFDPEHLRDSYDSGLMSESIEYPCIVPDPLDPSAPGDITWIRACYELELNEENDHLVATVALIDITHIRKDDEI